MKFNYVIYHKNCFDGFASFFLLHHNKLIDDDAIIYPDYPYSETIPPNLENKDVIAVDVAYNINIIKEIANKANSLMFIDHHITTHKDLEKTDFNNPDKITIIYDKTKSGVTLIWTTFYKSEKIPAFVKYIEDYDTGTFKYSVTKQFILALEVNYDLDPSKNNLIKWEHLFDKKEIIRLIKAGKFYHEYDASLTFKNKNKYSLMTFPSNKLYNEHKQIFEKPEQYKVAVFIGSPCPSYNSLSERVLMEIQCDFILFWVYKIEKKEYIITMRSKNVNVSDIAKLFGGGGHEYASSFSFLSSKYTIDDLFGAVLPRE